MTLSYAEVIKTKYPGAIDYGVEANFRVEVRPEYLREGTFNEDGTFTPPDNSDIPLVPVITLWDLPYPQPTIEELDAYVAGPEYLAEWGARLKTTAEAQVNAWANAKVIEFKILVDELFYVAMVANIGFLNTKWIQLGRPQTLDPLAFVCIHSEAQAYRDAHVGLSDFESQMSAYQLAGVQETKWQEMQNGFAGIVYARRLALERIKLAPVTADLEALLANIVADLDLMLGQAMQNLAAQQGQLIAQQWGV